MNESDTSGFVREQLLTMPKSAAEDVVTSIGV